MLMENQKYEWSIKGKIGKAICIQNSNAIFDAKRLVGCLFYEPSIQKDMKHWPFNVIEDVNGKPKIQVEYQGENR